MRKLIIRNWPLVVIAMMLAFVSPTAVFATDPPTGYTYNQTTGLWENGTYSWNPATGITTPLTPTDYSYNTSTGHWDTTSYVYDPTTSTYVPNTTSQTQGPTSPTGPTSSTGPATPTGTSGQVGPNTQSTISSTGPNSTNTNTDTSSASAFFSGFFNAAISNHLDSSATSGNATVSGNTSAGSATSGGAMTMATLLNLLQSSWLTSGGSPATFLANIVGNVNGDLTINPGATGPGSTNTLSNTQNNSLNVNNTANGQITNDLNLAATSGNAAVDSNTSAGNATSGNATVIANLINAINSSITSGQSFVGVINILGNLNGDILLPPDFINQLLAANGPGSTNSTTSSTNTTAAIQNTNNQNITNNLTTTANTGNAIVSNNTSAGSATTGQANTTITLLNLTGQNVIDKNTLLVFVNVLGHWVGLIVNAPAGTTSAALGGGVQSASTTSNNTLTANNTTNNSITNTITAAATSGDASVTSNTSAGNATSGNAAVGVNLLNMIDSNFDVSGWLGVLFINVLGSWNGSFGINTSAGDPIVSAVQAQTTGGNQQLSTLTVPQVFGFISHAANASGSGQGAATPASATTVSAADHIASSPTAHRSVSDGGNRPAAPNGGNIDWLLSGLVFGILLAAIFGGEQFVTVLRKR